MYMAQAYFKDQFYEQEKARRRLKFLKHYEVKMRLKKLWYQDNIKPKQIH